jgi:helix-loop-helix DNA-binding protein
MVEAGTTTGFIKSEPQDHSNNQNHFMLSQSGYGLAGQQFDSHFGNSAGSDGVDPSELTMQNGTFLPLYPFGSQPSLSTSFNIGNSGIDTDELLDLEINGQNGLQRNDGLNFLPDQRQTAGLSMSHQSHLYSQTPDGAPIPSPFIHGSFNYDHFQTMGQQSQQPTHSHLPNMNTHFDQNYVNSKGRPSLAIDRSSSDARSPMTPKTPGIGALNLGTPESGSFPTQSIRAASLQHRHQKTLSNQWDGTPGSAHSFIESPISSPGHPHHVGISEILKSGKHASLPTKVDTQSAQALETQEAKRRRRRASHNMVERRRRDNINERIQDLSHLVPQHRLEDDKVRKQLMNNTALSPTSAGGMSPPNAATSLLAGGNGRRATAGNITMGLPIDEKEKGPNKGDILNGAVGWMRDLMWALYLKIEREERLETELSKLHGKLFDKSEDEKRMESELRHAVERNDWHTFAYSRAPGSGLRVPEFTNVAGDAIARTESHSPQSLSPGFHSGGSGTNSGGQGQPQLWSSSSHPGISFKEEDEYSMEMN